MWVAGRDDVENASFLCLCREMPGNSNLLCLNRVDGLFHCLQVELVASGKLLVLHIRVEDLQCSKEVALWMFHGESELFDMLIVGFLLYAAKLLHEAQDGEHHI